MTGQEYHARMKELSDEMERLSRDFFGPIVAEYDQLAFSNGNRVHKVNVSALAKKYGTTQGALHKKLFGKNETQMLRGTKLSRWRADGCPDDWEDTDRSPAR